jgi:hypothetical protein
MTPAEVFPAFTTRSLNLAAFLRASGFTVEASALNEKQALFKLDSTPALIRAIEGLERDQARVSPRALDRARGELRGEIEAVLCEARRERLVDA